MTSTGKRPPAVPWALSAESETQLIERAIRLKGFVEQRPELDVHDVAYSLTASRALCHDHRAVVVGADGEELLSGLAAIASSASAPNVVSGRVAASGAVAFVFPAHGSPWTGAAVDLLEVAPVFADQMRLCDEAFAEFIDWSLVEALRGGSRFPDRLGSDVAQPLLFAVMVSLAAQWQAMGIQPDAVLGHSHGEVAAAYVAGGLSLRDAARVVVALGAATNSMSGTGGMVSIMRPVDRVHALIEPWARSISVAAQDGPSSTVVTGTMTALDELIAECEGGDVPVTRIPVDHASHSAHAEGLRESLRETLSELRPRTGTIKFISTVTGAGMDTSILDAEYWFANLRQPVLFEHAVRWAHDHGCRAFVESSEHPILVGAIQESLDALGDDHSVVGTLRRDEDGLRRLLLSASAAFVHGKALDWTSLLDATNAFRIELPA